MHPVERRRRYIAIALRRARPGSGSARTFLLERTWKGLPASMGEIDIRLLATPVVIVGVVATALYMPQRVPCDLALLVTVWDAPALYRELLAARCVRTGALAIGGSTWRTPAGAPLDILESTAPWARDAVAPPRAPPRATRSSPSPTSSSSSWPPAAPRMSPI